jgi:hypothetical protein
MVAKCKSNVGLVIPAGPCIQTDMAALSRRLLAALAAIATAVAAAPPGIALAEDQAAQEQPGKQATSPAEPSKEEKKKIDEFAEAARLIPGPAGLPECVWLGRRVVNLLWRDDLETAMRHIDLYDRFGCPAVHIQETFRCVIRQGNIDPKSTDSLNSRVHACWINPGLGPPPPATAATTPPAGTPGTSSQ